MELPLFPLHTVLCPGIAIPLHVFEPRYRALVAECIEEERPFGIVLIREGREVGEGPIAIGGVGTVAEIREAGRYPDGRYDILVVGTRRFAIEEVLTGQAPYLVARVSLLDDEVRDEPAARRLALTASRRFVRYLELLQSRPGETADEIDVRVEVETAQEEEAGQSESGLEAGEAEPPRSSEAADRDAPATRRVVIPDDPTVLSYLLTGIIQVELPRRQALLEAASTDDRLRALVSLIDRETLLLGQRLRAWLPDGRIAGPRRS